MFTIRVEYQKAGPFTSRTVYQAADYAVTYEENGCVAKLEHRDNVAMVLSDGMCAYVMNETGSTVDTIVTRRRPEHGQHPTHAA